MQCEGDSPSQLIRPLKRSIVESQQSAPNQVGGDKQRIEDQKGNEIHSFI